MKSLFKHSVCLGLLSAAVITAPVLAQSYGDDDVYGFVGPSDVQIIFQPEPVSYQPVSNVDEADEGKQFTIVCNISNGGRLENCYAEPNDVNDQNFVRIAITNARKWIVGPQLRNGNPSAGMAFRLVCRLDRTDRDPRAPVVASNDR